MKKFSKGLVVGLILGLIVGACSTAYAVQTVRMIVNGQEITSDVPAQVIDGRTLVPARALAEALGATVEWDAASNTVYITSGEVPLSVNNSTENNIGTYLADLEYVDKDYFRLYTDSWKDAPFKLYGTEYISGIGCSLNCYGDLPLSIEYNLDKKFTLLTGYFGIDDSTKSDDDHQGYMIIYGDGQKLYQSPFKQSGVQPEQIKLDVAGIQKLQIKFDGENDSRYIFADALLK